MRLPKLMKRYLILLAIFGIVATATTGYAQSDSSFVPVTDTILKNPEPSDWLMWRRTLNGWGYSPLDQIDRSNVDKLELVWARGLSNGSQQGTPLVYNGIMYMPNPFDVIQAIDAVTGDLIWQHRRDRPDDLDEYISSSLSQAKRNIAIYDNLIISTSADD